MSASAQCGFHIEKPSFLFTCLNLLFFNTRFLSFIALSFFLFLLASAEICFLMLILLSLMFLLVRSLFLFKSIFSSALDLVSCLSFVSSLMVDAIVPLSPTLPSPTAESLILLAVVALSLLLSVITLSIAFCLMFKF